MELYPHNQIAYDALCAMLRTEQRACVLQPPGTGKSFVAMKLVEDNPGKRILWLCTNPYIFSEQRDNFARAGVSIPDNLITMTYSYAMHHARKETLEVDAQIVVLDEFHHAGAPKWREGVEAVLSKCHDAKVVGFSATAIRYGDNCRNMAEELFFGNIASELTFEEAWIRGILPYPTYVCALYDAPEELGQILARIETIKDERKHSAFMARYQKLRRSIMNAAGADRILGKYLKKADAKLIVFCSNVAHLQKIYDERFDWFSEINSDIHAYRTYSSNPSGEDEYGRFKLDSSPALKVLYCINQLNEGVHVKGVDAVVMVRPTQSPVVFKQQLGRALDVGGSQTPLVFDLVNNIESARSITMFSSSLANAFEELRETHSEDLCDPVNFAIYDELRDARFLIKDLAEATQPGIQMISDARGTFWKKHWDYARNAEWSPYTTPALSNQEVYLKCPECNGEWEESARKMLRRQRCPYCSNELLLQGFNDIATKAPALASIWDESMNGVAANEVVFSHKTMAEACFWRCPEGHEWRESIKELLARVKSERAEAARKKKGGRKDTMCPHCANPKRDLSADSLAKKAPALAKQWRGRESEALLRGQLTAGRTSVYLKDSGWWECPKCRGQWLDSPYNRAFVDPACPYCSGRKFLSGLNDVATMVPDLVAEWNSADVSPEEVMYTDEMLLSWRCSKCGFVWKSSLQGRIKSWAKAMKLCDCPECESRSKRLFADGQRVRHVSHGFGIVSGMEGDIATIRFENGSTKKLAVRRLVQAGKLYAVGPHLPAS